MIYVFCITVFVGVLTCFSRFKGFLMTDDLEEIFIDNINSSGLDKFHETIEDLIDKNISYSNVEGNLDDNIANKDIEDVVAEDIMRSGE